MASNPTLPEHPKLETLASFERRTLRTRSAKLSSIPDEQPSIASRENENEAQRLSYGLCHEERRRWVKALRTRVLTEGMAKRMESCGLNAWVEVCAVTGQYRAVSPACKLRCCPRCAKIHAARTRARLDTWTATAAASVDGKLRLITLTTKKTSAPLTTRIDHLYRSYRKLRQRALWKKATTGAIAVLQVTWNDGWHPHLHIIQHGRFIEWRALRDAWKKCSGGSEIVDIRAIRGLDTAVDYVCRYVARPLNFGENADAVSDVERYPLMTEYALAIKGRRLLIASGDAPMETPEPPPQEHVWKYVDSVAGLLQRAQNYDREAELILLALAAREPDVPDQQLFDFDESHLDDAYDVGPPDG